MRGPGQKKSIGSLHIIADFSALSIVWAVSEGGADRRHSRSQPPRQRQELPSG